LLYNNNNDSAKSKMTPLPARNAYNSYSDAIARNCFGRQCRHSTVKMSIATVSADNVGRCRQRWSVVCRGFNRVLHWVYRPTLAMVSIWCGNW